jgi:hypothetical protein
LRSIRPSVVLHDRHSTPRTHEDFSSGLQAWSWSMKMVTVIRVPLTLQIAPKSVPRRSTGATCLIGHLRSLFTQTTNFT